MAPAEHESNDAFAASATRRATLARRRMLLAVYATVPLGAAAIVWFRSRGLVADTPLWLLVVLLVVTGLLNYASIVWLRGDPTDRVRIQVRLGISMLATTAVVYAIGWGPMLVVSYGVGFAIVLQEAGSASWRSGFAWSVLAVLLGQIAIEVGIAPTLIDADLADAVAIGGLFCFGVVARVLGVKAAAAMAEALERPGTSDSAA
jgi:hypothetical protein